ncbi:MAG: phosphate/phosphite/phosphonate ABC transporter substrate-binding protein [Hydrococcus sp. Prado102]|jgi:serine/threonine-protein kinase|nr:phosphate/phosphite/phosphonate ABC transporter substrate-binding protein [Hydrococcus sp. Prado102]
MPINLNETRQRGCSELRKVSARLNNGEKLDCSGVYGLTTRQLKALFSQIRLEWRHQNELERFIDLDTLNNELYLVLVNFLDSLKQPSPPPIALIMAIALSAVFGIYFVFAKLPPDPPSEQPPIPPTPSTPTPPSIQTNSITIGILGDNDYYSELVTYLQKTLGKQVKIKLDGDRSLTYQEAKNRLAKKRWDIAFTLSPMISVAAKDNGYSWVARMFPDKPAFYQSALFVKADSPIQSLEDIKPTTVIALGDFNSASSFYMPSYDLFGKSLAVDMGHRGQDIREMVRTGKADIGAAAYGDIITNDPDFRIIHISRNIPSSGVYLSPNLSQGDRQILTQVLRDAPEDVRKEANYGQSEEVDFSEFLGIVRRVEDVLACANFSQNPVNFYCAQEKGIVGQVNGLTRINEQTTRLTMKGKDGKNYQILVSPKTLNQIPGAGSAISLQNKTIQLLDTTAQQLADGKLKVTIEQPEQMKVLGN